MPAWSSSADGMPAAAIRDLLLQRSWGQEALHRAALLGRQRVAATTAVSEQLQRSLEELEHAGSDAKLHELRSHTRSLLAMRGSLAADSDGRIVGMTFEGEFNTGAYASWGPTVATRVPIHASGPYRVPHYLAEAHAIHTSGPTAGAFRGFGVLSCLRQINLKSNTGSGWA